DFEGSVPEGVVPTGEVPGGLASDYELMQAIAMGDPASLAALYDRYSGTVMAACLRVLGTRADAEEVLGDVFWHVWEQAGRYDPLRGNPVAYLMILARSRALDRLRAAGRRQRATGDPESSQEGKGGREPAGSRADPLREALASEQRSRIE